jgi:hypothetical protein
VHVPLIAADAKATNAMLRKMILRATLLPAGSMNSCFTSDSFREQASYRSYFVSSAPSSATITAKMLAGSVVLAFSLTV